MAVEKRVREWVLSNPPVTNFPGTQTDWEAYRRDYSQNCQAMNPGAIFRRKNKTLSMCQALFDEYTQGTRFGYAAGNKSGLSGIQAGIGASSQSIMLYGVLMVIVVMIIYFISKK